MTLDDRTLDQRLAALPRQTDVEEHSWLAIESRITRHSRQWLGRVVGGLAVAASVALAVLVTVPPDSTPSSVRAWVISAEVEAMQQQVSWADVPPQSAVNDGLTAAWEENEQAIKELERALARNPDNPMLMDFLAQARLRQSELIHHATSGSAVAQTWSL